MKTLSPAERNNMEKYLDTLAGIDPSLLKLWEALQGLGVRPEILIPIARSLSLLSMGTGFGKIQIQMTNRRITLIRGEENIEINEEVLVDKEIIK